MKPFVHIQGPYPLRPDSRSGQFFLYSILLWTLVAAPPLHAQPNTLWTRTVPACQDAVSVAVTPEGDYVAVGNSKGVNSSICLAKVTVLGEVLWQKTISSGGADIGAASMVAARDGGYVIAGARKPDSGSTDGYVVKIDEQGSVVWESILGGDKGDFFAAIAQSADGGYVLAGTTWSFSDTTSGGDVYLVKTNSEGRLAWEQAVDDAYLDRGEAVIETTDGDVVAAGWIQDLPLDPMEYQQLLVRTDAEGSLRWKQRLRSQERPGVSSRAYGVASTATGGFLVAGWADYFIAGAFAFLVETDAEGGFLREQIFIPGGLGDNVLGSDTEIRSIKPTSDGGYVLGGYVAVTRRPFEESDIEMYVAKLDAAGTLQREGLVPGANLEKAEDIVEAPDGGYVLAGKRRDRDNSTNRMYIAKVALDTNTGLETPTDRHPIVPSLKENYPNPFKSQTTIAYRVPRAGPVRLVVYDVLGREVAVLAEGVVPPGRHLVAFDVTDIPSGVYLYRLEAGGYVEARTMALVK